MPAAPGSPYPTVDQKSGLSRRDDLAMRSCVGSQRRRSPLPSPRATRCDRVRSARSDMQVAGGQHLGDRAGGRRTQKPEPIGIDRRVVCQQVRRVIAVMKFDVEPAPDHRVAHDDAQDVGSGLSNELATSRNRSNPRTRSNDRATKLTTRVSSAMTRPAMTLGPAAVACHADRLKRRVSTPSCKTRNSS